MLLYGDFQPKMRTQYSAQYNLTIQRELARDVVLQVGLRRIAGTPVAGFA